MKIKIQLIIRKIKILIQLILNNVLLELNIKYCYMFPLILSQLNIHISDSDSSLTHLSFGVFLLSFVALMCFINIIGYLISYIILQKGNFEEKYPKLKKI